MFDWFQRWMRGHQTIAKEIEVTEALRRAEAQRLRALDQYLDVMTITSTRRKG